MPNRNPNRIRQRDERGHPVVRDAIDRGYEASRAEYPIGPLPSHAIANESRLIIGRALEHHGYPRAAWVTDEDGIACYKDCQDPNAPHYAYFRLHNKDSARKHVFSKAGGNPANLKYNPYVRRGNGTIRPS